VGDSKYVPGGGAPSGSSSDNPFAAYSIGNRSSGTYVGVPDNYKVTVGYAQGWAPDYSHGYQGQVPGQTMKPVVRVPIYTYDDLVGLRGQPPANVFDTQRALYNAGYLTGNFRAGFFDRNTEEALSDAMADANRNGMKLPEMFGMIAQGQKGLKGSGSSGGGGGGGGPRDIVSKSVSLTGRAGAQSVLTQALAQQLGREPTAKEVTRFLHSLNAEERQHPTITRTHISAGGANQSSTTEQSDVDASGEAVQWGKKNKALKGEATKYQDSLYYDVLSSMLTGG
jgi:hypothetical protein